MRILDRYVLKNFLIPFLLCLFGFIAIWLVFDLGDHIGDFIEYKASMHLITAYYLSQLPEIMVISLPVGLLLALLYSLSRMSRSNEIISMLTAGQSVSRILVPLMFAGLFVSAVCMGFNYKLAPHSEASKKSILDQIVRGKDKELVIEGELFRNRFDFRTWYVQKIRASLDEVVGVHITQQDANGNITRKYYAHSGKEQRSPTDPTKKNWRFTDAMVVNFDPKGNIIDTKSYKPFLEVNGWSETPWRIWSANMDAQNMSVSELHDYLRFNSDFPSSQLAPFATNLGDRWSLAWSCLVVIFIAAPLGIVYSRRGVLAGVAVSIFIFFGMMFVRYLFLALGKGARISPVIAAWSPDIIFGMIGFYLLWLRSNNRELPNIADLFKKKVISTPTARLTPAYLQPKIALAAAGNTPAEGSARHDGK